MRLLPQRLGADRKGFARQNATAHRTSGAERVPESHLPLRQPHADLRRHQTGLRFEQEGVMARRQPPQTGLSRREFIRDAGGLVIGFSMLDAALAPQLLAQSAASTMPGAVPPSPAKLESWLHILPDGGVQVFTGKLEIGMGVDTAFTQIVAEELDVSPSRVKFVLGDTATTTDQGGVGGSTSISQGARPLRNVAAAARAALVQRASQQLGVPADQLQVKDGVISVRGVGQTRQVTYGQLASAIAAEQDLKVTGAGFALNVE